VLYPADAHAPLTSEQWDESRVRQAICGIVDNAAATYDPDEFWHAHEWDGFQAALPMKNVYCGAAGAAWALDALRRRGHAEGSLDPVTVAQRALDAFRREPDFMTEEAKLPAAALGHARRRNRNRAHALAARPERRARPRSSSNSCARTSATPRTSSCGRSGHAAHSARSARGDRQ